MSEEIYYCPKCGLKGCLSAWGKNGGYCPRCQEATEEMLKKFDKSKMVKKVI